MRNLLKLFLLFFVVVALSGCDWWWEDDDDDVEAASGAAASATVPVQEVATQTQEAPAPAEETSSPTIASQSESMWYRGRTNPDRPTWYAPRNMSAYGKSFTVEIHGCRTLEITNSNGSRWESGGYLCKQSDVSGRGMACLAPSSCGSRSATVSW